MLMNDYGADWPFWGGIDGGNCADGDPGLPVELVSAARAWAAQFNNLFDYEQGWPDRTTAEAHRVEGERLYEAVKRALAEHELEFDYWERDVRPAR